MFSFDDTYYNMMRIFIASPGDTEEERQIADDVIKQVDIICRDTLGLHAECLRWEDMPPLTPTPDEGSMQDKITRDLLNRCNVFVLILNKRYGTVTKGQKASNTELEVETILNALEKKKNVTLLSYFKELPSNEDPGKQEKGVRDLQKRLTAKKLIHHSYKNTAEFRDKFTHHLYYVAIRFAMSVTKQRSLRSFWELGALDGRGVPELSIIYPPLDRISMKIQDPDNIWLERLTPNVVFEDFKAMNKVEKTLRLIGHHHINTYTASNFPQSVYDQNRLWLCLPRNKPAARQMAKYQDQAWFKFEPRRDHEEGIIYWRSRNSQKYITINSPLSRYLQIQRQSTHGGNWTPEHGRIIAKDYAILARFTDPREASLKDYFLAGIRGLGTWGAGWFIDRRYKAFLQWEDRETEPIQMLLEVTYKNEHIDEVKDVSSYPPEYFENEENLETIQKYIDEHHNR